VSRPKVVPALSVVVPAYNERRRLPGTLERLRRHLDAAREPYECIVVDDGSGDGTGDLVEAAAPTWPELRCLRLPFNEGKGRAVQAGMIDARAELRLFSDADLSTPIEELTRLRAALAEGADIAIASRALPASRVEVHQAWTREAMGKTYNRMLQLLVLPGIHDSQCGFKLYTARAVRLCFEPLTTFRFGFDAEVLLRARLAGLRVAEVPVRWEDQRGTRVSSVRDSSQMLVDLLRLRRRLGRARRPAAG